MILLDAVAVTVSGLPRAAAAVKAQQLEYLLISPPGLGLMSCLGVRLVCLLYQILDHLSEVRNLDCACCIDIGRLD